jgi:hypothetical protein
MTARITVSVTPNTRSPRCRAVKISSVNTRTFPPNNNGALNDAIDVINVNNAAAISDGVSCGNSTRRNTAVREAPRLRAASARLASMRRSPAPVST